MNLISVFTEHRLAANLAMVVMILAGVWSISQLAIQLNPQQQRQAVGITISWRGASAEDMEKLVTNPLEQQLWTVPDVKSLRSTTRDTNTYLEVSLDYGADVQKAIDEIKQRVGRIRSFPPDIEPPVVSAQEFTDLVAAVLISGPGEPGDLVPIARQLETELMNRGLTKISFQGLPSQELAIQVGSQTLFEMGVSVNELGLTLARLSQDTPGGTIGAGQMSRQLRGLDQRRDVEAFNELPVFSNAGHQLILLRDIATVEKRTVIDQPVASVGGEPAIVMYVRRAAGTDALDAARKLNSWLAERQATLTNIDLQIFLEAWVFIRDELNLILENGATGLVLVIITLLVFLQLRVGFWVMVGIPVTFMAALLGFYLSGGTINAISLIAIVMALGIVVDDAIVVAEEASTRFEQGASPLEAAQFGARRMLGPVIASSLTTLCAFMPLLLIEGSGVSEIPLMMMWVIAASLIECFLILPGHLKQAFTAARASTKSAFRERFDAGFARFREERVRPMVRLAMANRRLVVGGAFCIFFVPLYMWMSGWIKTEFNLSLDFEEVSANVQFTGNATQKDKLALLANLEAPLAAADESLGGDNLVMSVTTRNFALIANESKQGSQYASMRVQLVSPEKRAVSAEQLASAWLERAPRSAFLDALSIKKQGSYRSDFSFLLKGQDTPVLKAAGEALMAELATLDGVSNLNDDLPYGKEQWIFSLTTEGRALGLTTAELGSQLRGAYNGQRIQIFQQDRDELEVKLILPESERTNLSLLGQFPIKAPGGEMVPLATVATWEGKRGIDIIRHHNTERSIKISGDVDKSLLTGSEVVQYFNEHVRDKIVADYRVTTGLDDMSLAEQETGSDFGMQFLVALALIYIVLAWIFASYTWPLAVMAAIPLGLTGALLGHVFMGMNIGPMSMLGLFTLTGIIVNDSIILVSAYKLRVQEGIAPMQAIEDAVCARLRPVILTSITTTAGLFPLMLEQAPIAEIFTPLAAAICFGMLYGTVLVLIVIPALLSIVVSITERFGPADRPDPADTHGENHAAVPAH